MAEARVLDASAVLAYLQEEQGEGLIEAALDEGPCRISTVNVCEILGKLCDSGMSVQDAQQTLDGLGLIAVDFDAELARLAASLRVRTRSIGASLGDRACLALAEQTARIHGATTVYTADRAWARLKWPFKVVVVR